MARHQLPGVLLTRNSLSTLLQSLHRVLPVTPAHFSRHSSLLWWLLSFPSQPPYRNGWQDPSVTLYHHRGMEARHFPTTFATPQDSETKQNPCGLLETIPVSLSHMHACVRVHAHTYTHSHSVGGSLRSRFSKRQAKYRGLPVPLTCSQSWCWCWCCAASLYGKKGVTWQPSPKRLMQLHLQLASALTSLQ